MSKLLLLGAALTNLQREGRLAWLWITQYDIISTCAAEEDCEGIVNLRSPLPVSRPRSFSASCPKAVSASASAAKDGNVAASPNAMGGGGQKCRRPYAGGRLTRPRSDPG